MAYNEMSRKGYGVLITQTELNQIKANLEAIHDRLVDPGTGVQVRQRTISISSGASGSVAGGTTWIKEPLNPNQYIEIMSSNYPAHKRFVVGFFGYITAYQHVVTATEVVYDLYISKNYTAPSSSHKGTLPLKTGGTAGTRVTQPVNFMMECEADGVSNWKAFLILKIVNCGTTAVIHQAGASGTVWYKEI
jgi:hypothetical protein